MQFGVCPTSSAANPNDPLTTLTLFQILLIVIFAFLLKGSSGYGRPSSLVEYNQLPVAPVSQSSTLTYQTSHPQSEQPIKNLMCSGGVKTLCYVFIVCRAVTFWLSLLLVANKLRYQLPTPFKHLIWQLSLCLR